MKPVVFTAINLSCGVIYDVLSKSFYRMEGRERVFIFFSFLSLA